MLSIRVYAGAMDKDIATLLGEIKAATLWSEPQIAAQLGTSQPTVNRILNGQVDCKGSTFKAITDLHIRVFPVDALSVAPQQAHKK